MTRIVEITRNFHYFIEVGGLMQLLSDLNVMSGLLACMVCDVAHPGVNNPFLLAMRHTKAIRYSD